MPTPIETSEANVASPCNNVCRIDERTGWCEGCLRSLDEITAWSTLDDSGKQGVHTALARRRASLPAGWPEPP